MIDQIEVIPTHRESIVIIIIEIQSWEMHSQTIFQLGITKTLKCPMSLGNTFHLRYVGHFNE